MSNLSSVWLRYFRFGPFEWVWRSLTYWKKITDEEVILSHLLSASAKRN